MSQKADYSVTGATILKHISRLKTWLKQEDGATAIEYALIAGAMGLMLIPAMSSFTDNSEGLYQSILDIFNHPMFQPGYFS
jgi:Flp pilus assembly pilin Flp